MSKLPIAVPGSSSSPKYIEWIRVTYKATSWIFNYYDWERKDVETIEWIIVWWGFQFDTQKGKPNKKKSASLVSNEFWFEIMTNNTPIRMRELIRENGTFESVSAGAKTYKDWKDAWQRLTKVVYVLDANDTEKLYKIQFSWLSFWAINKLLVDDLPNYVSVIKASEELKSTDNWDFYMPTIEKKWDLPEELYDKVIEKVNFVYQILNESQDVWYETVLEDSNNIATQDIEDVFWEDDIP